MSAAPVSLTPRASPGAITVALVGNPNTGKTSLFNALTGFRRHVANYPGVTVEVASGPVRGAAGIRLFDLPGTYSLSAMSPDEMIVAQFACGRSPGQPRPDVLLAILDATNLARNLYLVSQLLELNLPLVVALNMMDVARARGLQIDCQTLSRRLGAPVVPVVAVQPKSTAPLIAALERAASAPPSTARAELPEPLRREVAGLADEREPALAARVLLDRGGEAERQYLDSGGAPDRLSAARERLTELGDPARAEVQARYAWVARVAAGVVTRPATPVVTWSDRLDAVLTHPYAGGLILAAVLFLVFQSIFTWAGPLMDRIDSLFARLSAATAAALPEGAAQSLLCDGVIAGVGGVLIFLPQIVILFALIAILEDCGYLARAAHMMDRVMRTQGLSGRSFIPLLSSFACAVPAIMGARVIADRRERFLTILLAPFMSCSARLPVYVLMIGAFVPKRSLLGGWIGIQGLVMLSMYLVGVVAAVGVGWLLRRTSFRGSSLSFVLELPSFKWPRVGAVVQRMSFAARGFIVRAGTVILAVNLVVWALGYFPHSVEVARAVSATARERGWDAEREASELAGAHLRASYLGRMGRAIEPVVRPLGWDWRIGVAVIASFPAREVVVATLGTVYNLGGEVDESSESLRDAMRAATWPGTDRPVFTLPVALSIMVFFALCAQCSSTLVVIGREMRSWSWPIVSFVGMTLIAFVAAFCVSAAFRGLGL